MFLKGSTFLCIRSTGRIHHGKAELHLTPCVFSRFGADVWIDCSVSAAASQKAPERQLWRSGEPHDATSNHCRHGGRRERHHVFRPRLKPNQPSWQIVRLSLNTVLAAILQSLLHSPASGWNIYTLTVLLGGAAPSVARLIRIRKHWTTLQTSNVCLYVSVWYQTSACAFKETENTPQRRLDLYYVWFIQLSVQLFQQAQGLFHPRWPIHEPLKLIIKKD